MPIVVQLALSFAAPYQAFGMRSAPRSLRGIEVHCKAVSMVVSVRLVGRISELMNTVGGRELAHTWWSER